MFRHDIPLTLFILQYYPSGEDTWLVVFKKASSTLTPRYFIASFIKWKLGLQQLLYYDNLEVTQR
jgi:hypothetical protein